MSAAPLTCSRCKLPGTLAQFGPFPGQGNESTFAVTWRCPRCQDVSLDICPFGPLVPVAGSCLNCGGAGITDDHPCPDCGLTPSATASFLHLEPSQPSLPAIADLCDRGLFRRALAELNRLLIETPTHPAALQLKVGLLRNLRFYRSIVTLLEQLFPQQVPTEFLFIWARSLQEARRHAEAVTAYRQFLAGSPDLSEVGSAHCNVANSLHALGELEEAETHYRLALDHEGPVLMVLYNYAAFLMRQRRWSDALRIVDSAVRPDSTEPLILSLWEDKAYLHCELDDATSALAAADAALKAEPNRIRALFLRGRALSQLGRLEEARAELQRVVAMEPDHVEAQQGLANLNAVLGTSQPKRWWEFWK